MALLGLSKFEDPVVRAPSVNISELDRAPT